MITFNVDFFWGCLIGWMLGGATMGLICIRHFKEKEEGKS